MKKRIVALNCVLCAVLLSVCSFGEENSQQSSDSSSEDYTYSEDESSDAVVTEKDENEAEADYKVVINDNYSVIYTADLEGDVTGKYDIEDIKKIFAENKSSFTPEHFELEHEGILYYSCSGEND